MSDTETRLTDTLLTQLARDVAQDIFPIGDILEQLQITQDQFEEIKLHPQFTRLLQSAVAEWAGATNTPARIAVKSAAAVELAIPGIFAAINNKETPLTQRVDGLKTLAKLGKLIDQPQAVQLGAAVGGGFSIIIAIGDKQLTFGGPPPPPVTTIEHESAPEPAEAETSGEWG